MQLTLFALWGILFSGFRFIKAGASGNGFCSFPEGHWENSKNFGNCLRILSVCFSYINLAAVYVLFSIDLYCTIIQINLMLLLQTKISVSLIFFFIDVFFTFYFHFHLINLVVS